MIDPGTNLTGETVEAYCHRRWGGAGWTRHLISEVKKDGANFGNWQWWPHTLKAHQLVEYCSKNGICSTDRVNQLLFQAQYERGENISQVDTLVQIMVRENSLDDTAAGDNNKEKEDELRDYLSQDKGKQKVKEDIQVGRQRYGITGVPFFVVKKEQGSDDNSVRPYGFSGAQKSETFLDIFHELS